jgi:hypothetical protein
LASIVYNAPFNAQVEQPISVTVDFTSISADNFVGVFLTDNIGSRAFHLGALFNMSAKQIALNADNGGGFNPAQDRITLGTLAAYSGGQATMSFSFDESGFSVEFNAGAAGAYSSGKRPWSQVPGGFDPSNLGEQTQLFIQSFDVNGGTPASVIVNSISVTRILQGDFNGDGVVNAADYVMWRKTGGTQDQFNLWRANFGQSLGQGVGADAPVAVPDATSLLPILMAAAIYCVRRPDCRA